MKRIALSALIAIGVHGLLLSADFNHRRGPAERAEIPDRLTLLMLPAAAPMPAKKDLPAPHPPPAPELMADVDLAKIPGGLPAKLPDADAPPAADPKPKESLKARTFRPVPSTPESGPEPRPAVQPQLQASGRTENQAPAAMPPPARSPDAADASEKLVPLAAAYKPRDFFPDRPAIPLLEENPPPLYPEAARRRGYQGSVVLKVLVNVNGGVDEIEIEESCGYDILDRTALAAVKEWRFKPGIKDGRKIRTWVKVPVRFQLK